MKENQAQPARSWKRGFASFEKWLVRILGVLLLAGLVYQFVMTLLIPTVI